MNFPLTLVSLAGSVALLLWGGCTAAGKREGNLPQLGGRGNRSAFRASALRSHRHGGDKCPTSGCVAHLKSVNAHLVAGAAYPRLESKGDLLPNRLRQEA